MRRGWVWQAAEGTGLVRHGLDGRDVAGLGVAGWDVARQGEIWSGPGQERHGLGRGGADRLGMVRRGDFCVAREKVEMARAAQGNAEVIAIGPAVTNDGANVFQAELPYRASVTIEGVADLIFHRWNVEAVDAKSKAAKGSKEKKSDNIYSYVYRDDAGNLCLPGEYLRQSIIHAAKFKQDPRSPRKSAMDLYKAAVVATTELASLGSRKWDFEDRRRVTVQRAGITRIRPAFKAGWRCTIELLITLPEYVSPPALNEVIVMAGRVVGVGDNRPSYGQFMLVDFKVLPA